MKKQIIIFISFLLFISSSSFAQTSYPIKKINGKDYYLYKVQASEGLFAIARKFGTSSNEIIKLNPEASQGIKLNQELLIPIIKSDNQTSDAKVAKSSSTPKYIEHKVEKQQTLFAISKKYNVNIDDIKKINPQLVNGLIEGNVIKIPVSTPTPTPLPTTAKVSAPISNSNTVSIEKKQEEIIKHKVLPKETLYSICKRYGVSIDEVIQLNSNATNLTAGSELKIPAKASTEPTSIKNNDITSRQNNAPIPSSIINKTDRKSIRLGFLLPFMLNQEKKDNGIERFIDFYSGALMAINEAKKQGVNIEVYVYDSEKTDEKVAEILKKPELKTLDLLIGPAFSSQIPEVGKFAKENKVYTLIPFSSKVPEIQSNKYLFQFNPGADVDLIVNQAKNMRIIFAEVPGINETDAGKVWADELKRALTKSGKTYSVIELSSSDYANYGSVLKKAEKNLIIFNTDKYSSVSSFLSPLRLRANEYDIVFYEHFAWRNQDIKMPQTMFISPFISKLEPEVVTNFNAQYASFFNHEVHKNSPRYDLLGYDLLNYFIKLLTQYGEKFTTEISSFKDTKGIQSQPHFERISETGGFVNDQLYLGEEKLQ
jgi:LysM repeat protein